MKYVAAFGIQPRGQEIINGLAQMVSKLVRRSRGDGNPKQERHIDIIYLRDGVGESQYNAVSIGFTMFSLIFENKALFFINYFYYLYQSDLAQG